MIEAEQIGMEQSLYGGTRVTKRRLAFIEKKRCRSRKSAFDVCDAGEDCYSLASDGDASLAVSAGAAACWLSSADESDAADGDISDEFSFCVGDVEADGGVFSSVDVSAGDASLEDEFSDSYSWILSDFHV